MKTRSISTLVGSALAAAAMSMTFTPAALAQEAQPRTVGVTHSDLDLTTAEGVAELDRRIDRAAKEVCGFDEVAVGTRLRSRETTACYRDAKRQLDRQFAQIVRNAQRDG